MMEGEVMGFSGIASDSNKNYDSSKGEMGVKMYIMFGY